MRESEFISINRPHWEELEAILTKGKRDPDKLHELFVKVSSDLSYARSFYPNRTVRLYLNELTQRVLDLIQTRRKRISYSDIRHFYMHALPAQLWRARKSLLASFLIFGIAVVIGAISTYHNIEFARTILGDQYVALTNDNINDGDPMAIYKSMGEVRMFWGITINNVRVAFIAFIMGLLGSVGTVIILISNGIMLGTFQCFFYKKGLFLTSFLTIWIHGTIEISAIIIAGAAGIVLGDGLLHPRTYSRSLSLRVASRRAIRILLSTVPLFIIAGFLESFVTRHTQLPDSVKWSIILLSLVFILFHFMVIPYRYYRKFKITDDDYDVPDLSEQNPTPKTSTYLKFSEVIEVSLSQFRYSLGSIIGKGLAPLILLVGCGYWIWAKINSIYQVDYESIDYSGSLLQHELGGAWLLILHLLALTLYSSYLIHVYMVQIGLKLSFASFIRTHFWKVLLLLTPVMVIYHFTGFMITMVVLLFVPPQLFYITIHDLVVEKKSFRLSISNAFNQSYTQYVSYLPYYFFLIVLLLLVSTLLQTLAGFLIMDFLSWHPIFPGDLEIGYYIDALLNIAVASLVLPLALFCYFNQALSNQFKSNSSDLFHRINQFGNTT